MCKVNKNRIIEFYFSEDDDKSYDELKDHINSCPECIEYLDSIKKCECSLDKLTEAEPLPDTFEMILDKIYEVPQVKPARFKVKSVNPVIFLATIIVLILSLIFVVQVNIQSLELWKYLKNSWIVETFGSYGFVAILFFCAGSFITLSIAPILYINSKHGSKIILK